jgi:membrane associated rhomboid family serine protease
LIKTKLVKPIIIITLIMWVIELIGFFSGHGISQALGIHPRSIYGLIGIPFAPFLHFGIGHMFANTFPFIVLSFLVSQYGISNYYKLTAFITVLGGLLVWGFGGSGVHAGASALIMGYWGYLLSYAYFTRSFKSIVITLVTILIYWGLFFTLLNFSNGTSTSGHIFGLISGIMYGMIESKNKGNTSVTA